MGKNEEGGVYGVFMMGGRKGREGGRETNKKERGQVRRTGVNRPLKKRR